MALPRSPVPFRVIFATATALSVFSTLMAWQLTARAWRLTYVELALLNTFYWYAWALLAPFIMRLAVRVPFERHDWFRRAFPIHLVAAIVCAGLHIFTLELLRRGLAIYFGRTVTMPFLTRLRSATIQFLDWEMMTYWAIIGVAFAVTYYRQAQDRAVATARLETKLVETRLQTLQSQLHPHFLFNTLHAISALMHSDVDEADRMLSRLGGLLRMTLDHSTQQEVTLKEELDFVERYLLIEQTRFGDRLNVKFAVAPETLDALVPWMVLQPLVENAIKHGIAPQAEPGTVEIVARTHDDRLVLEVRDDGVGLTQDALTALQSGIGLSTTRARLFHLYGRDYQFEFHRRPKGVAVRVVIPRQEAPSAAVGSARERSA